MQYVMLDPKEKHAIKDIIRSNDKSETWKLNLLITSPVIWEYLSSLEKYSVVNGYDVYTPIIGVCVYIYMPPHTEMEKGRESERKEMIK